MQQEARTALTDTWRLEAAAGCDRKHSRSFSGADNPCRSPPNSWKPKNCYEYSKLNEAAMQCEKPFPRRLQTGYFLFDREADWGNELHFYLRLSRNISIIQRGNSKGETFREQTAGGFMTSSKLKVFFPHCCVNIQAGKILSDMKSFQSG